MIVVAILLLGSYSVLTLKCVYLRYHPDQYTEPSSLILALSMISNDLVMEHNSI